MCLIDGSENERLVRMILMREGEFEEREVVSISLSSFLNEYGLMVMCGYIFLIPFSYLVFGPIDNLEYVLHHVNSSKSNLVWT